MNTPYVKKYDSLGQLLNPINGIYTSNFPSRRARNTKKNRDFNNSANCQMTVIKTDAYRKRIQLIDGKPIVHYILKKK